MSYNGSGTFNINTAGQPVVTGTVITATAFNALTADLGTGLSTAITKDGQTTPTANIPLGTFKITGLGAGTAGTDAVRLSQLQSGGTTSIITVSGTDTITGTVSPTLTAYATGQQFSFFVAATNTTAVTLNVDSVGAKAVTRTGSVALVAGDMIIGQVVIVEYDGTRFQLINGNNLRVAGTTSGIATIVTPAAAGTPTITLPIVTGTLATLAGTETLTNKTLTAPVIATIVNSGTLTLPTSTDTLVGKATTDTLTNKTLTAPVIASITNTGTLTLPTLTGTVGLATRTVQVFTSSSGTYTTPTGCKAIQIELIGGGGGGAGGGTSPGAAGAGGNSTFTTLTGSGGAAGNSSASQSAGGAASGGDVNIAGSGTDAILSAGNGFGVSGRGASSVFSGGGSCGYSYSGGSTAGTAAPTNSGAGGGGGGVSSGSGAGSGGGGGGYVRKLISSPTATYSYAVGAAGTAGTAGTGGSAGGAGGSGIIIVTESY